jgi:hypothetical protein
MGTHITPNRTLIGSIYERLPQAKTHRNIFPTGLSGRTVFLSRGDNPFGSADSSSHYIFPVNAVVVKHHAQKGSVGEQIAMYGFDDFYGPQVDTATAYQVLQPGEAIAVLTGDLRRCQHAFDRLSIEQQARQIQSLANEIRCTARHTSTQRIARWILSVALRSPLKEIWVSQSFLGGLLALRRETVADALANLEAAGAIFCSRSKITLLDLSLIQASCCDCDGLVPRSL